MLLVQAVLVGVFTGGVYALMAAGFNLVFGVMRVINFAHGDLAILGGYLAYILFRDAGMSPLLSLPVVMLIMFAVGMALHRLVIAPVILAPELTVVLVTFGLSKVLTDLMVYTFSATARFIPTLSGAVLIGPLALPRPRMLAFGLAVFVTMAMWLYLHRTRTGKRMRAVAQNRDLARICGVRVGTVELVAFALSVLLAAAAGVLLLTMYPINPVSGERFLVHILAVAVVGGLGSFPGALVGAELLGVLESLMVTFVSGRFGSLIFYLALVLVLVFRPEGLLGVRHAAGR